MIENISLHWLDHMIGMNHHSLIVC